MKTVKDFLRANNGNYECVIGVEDILLSLIDEQIRMVINGTDEYLADD